MLQKKHIADYLNSFVSITSLCDVYADIPLDNPNDTYIYPVLINDSQSLYTNKGLRQRIANIRLNIVLAPILSLLQYPEGTAYEIFETIEQEIINICGSKDRNIGGFTVISIQNGDISQNGYLNDRFVFSKTYDFIYEV